MRIDILTLFPEMFEGFLTTSIIKRAIEHQIIDVRLHNFRDYTMNKHKKVDDTPYGGGAGMVLTCQPIVDCLDAIKQENSLVCLLSPQGETFCQKKATDLAHQYTQLIFICGHYEGFDERILKYIDCQLSIGDYVLTGGELGAMVITDAITRLLDGAITKESHEDDSFSNGLLEYPQYTKPVDFRGDKVPDVLLSGHHENIRRWRLQESLKKTWMYRPDLLENRTFTKEELIILEKLKNENK